MIISIPLTRQMQIKSFRGWEGDSADCFIKAEYFSGHKSPNFVDIRRGINKAYRPHEIDSFIDLELKYKSTSRASRADEAGDIIMEIYGVEQSLDPMGLSYRAINPWIENFEYNYGKFKESILDHFDKIHSPVSGVPPLDKVVIDFKHMDQIDSTLKQKVLDYIESPTFEYKQYVNENYLIKLNL